MLPTYRELHELFTFDSENGILRWKVARSNVISIGQEAGYVSGNGYRMVNVNKKMISTHRIAWCMEYGYWPEYGIDHINRDKEDNRIENLREVSQSCNMQNASIRSDNTSGVRGVTYESRSGNWIAAIRIAGKNYHIKSSPCLQEAAAHRKAVEQCLALCHQEL